MFSQATVTGSDIERDRIESPAWEMKPLISYISYVAWHGTARVTFIQHRIESKINNQISMYYSKTKKPLNSNLHEKMRHTFLWFHFLLPKKGRGFTSSPSGFYSIYGSGVSIPFITSFKWILVI